MPPWAVHEHYVLRLLWSLTRQPDEIVLRWQEQSSTRWELSGRIVRAASALHDHGIGPDHRVAVLTRINSPEMLITRYAAHLIGASVVYVHSANPRGAAQMLPEQIQAQILRKAGARVLVTDHDHLDRSRTVAGLLGGSLMLAGSGFAADGVLRLDADSGSPVRSISYRPDDTAIVTFTSGTTGHPKNIVQPFRVWNATVNSFASTTDPGAPATFLAVTPLSYTIGSMVDSVIIGGGRVVLRSASMLPTYSAASKASALPTPTSRSRTCTSCSIIPGSPPPTCPPCAESSTAGHRPHHTGSRRRSSAFPTACISCTDRPNAVGSAA